MDFTRRDFIKGGVAAFTWGFAAPAFVSDIALAQGSTSRNLVILYFSGGNDSLSTVIPYNDSFYYSRRPTIAVPAANVLQVGSDAAGRNLGLHPNLPGLQQIFNQGKAALMMRTGYANQSRSHFQGFDIWSTGAPSNSQGPGWLGRYLDTLPAPVDPLVGWSTQRETPHPMIARNVGVAAIPSVSQYAFSSPNSGTEATLSRNAAVAISSHVPVDRPHLSFVNGTVQSALATLDRVATVGTYAPSVTYPNTGLGQAMKAVAGAMIRQIGTKVFWVQTGGFDTHATQGAAGGGAYAGLMKTVDDAVFAFYNDMSNQGLIGSTTILEFSEFARRITENGSGGTDHGEGGLMMAIGGGVHGGLYGTAPDLNPYAGNPTLSNSNGDVKWDIDFRSVYARILDNWLGGDSVAILGGDFRNPGLSFIG
jgi:uncharacterized protein (DUF1501 family)